METDTRLGVAPIVWLDDRAVSSSPPAIKAEAAKLDNLRTLGADRLDRSAVSPERVRQLAALAKRLTPKALREMAPKRRYPILLAALASLYASVVDELVRMFDQALTGADSRARLVAAEREAALVEANIERLDLLDEILVVALDKKLDGAAVGAGVRGLGRQRLVDAVRGEEERLPQ